MHKTSEHHIICCYFPIINAKISTNGIEITPAFSFYTYQREMVNPVPHL